MVKNIPQLYGYRLLTAAIIGCGSIGRRHISNLLKRRDIKKIIIITSMPPDKCVSLLSETDKDIAKKKSIIKISRSLSDITGADFAIIANETYKHITTAQKALNYGIRNIFVEKPLAANLKDALHFKKIYPYWRKNILISIGYNLRFLGAIRKVKELIKKNIVGKIYFAQIEVGQYLPAWRPGSDYASSYSASASKGGGAALDLSHEVDYMRFLFGEPLRWKIFKTRVSQLKIDSEDIFEGMYLYPGSGFLCYVHCDYLQMPKKRSIRIVGSDGEINCDLVARQITIKKDKTVKTIRDEKLFDVSSTYVEEIDEFIKSVKKNRQPQINLTDGIEALRLISSDGENKNV